MRFVIGVSILLCLCRTGYAFDGVKDSLQQLLLQEENSLKRCTIYRNLADLSYDTPDERRYLKLLYQEAIDSGDQELLLDVTGDIAAAYLAGNYVDSASFYIKCLEKMEYTEAVEAWQTYLDMLSFNANVLEGDGAVVIDNILKNLEAGYTGNVYSRIKNAYVVANSFYIQEKADQALKYAVTAEKLAATLPFKTGYKIHRVTIRLLSHVMSFLERSPEAISLIEESIRLLEKYYEQCAKRDRPYYYINSLRINIYGTLMTNAGQLPAEKADYYFQKIQEYSKEVVTLYDKYSCYYAMNNYYLAKENWPEALATNDSLIKYAGSIASYNISGLYKISSQIYELAGDNKGALDALKKSYFIRDSLDESRNQKHLDRLQVQYDLHELRYEKSQLEIKNKKILVVCLLIILFFMVAICVYLYRGLKRERVIKAKLYELNAKAEASEEMKTAFIRSVCHEIRTPLNAIVGFADLLCGGDLDDEMRQQFPVEIHRNSALLTSLVSRMLEVAELDVSKEKLPVESVDLHLLCVHAMERAQDRGKPDISYLLDVPEEAFMISTNKRYLGVVLDNLLDNANKFTESGDIVLHFEADKVSGRLFLSIKDTGCGIPAEMHEKVFERFSKLDPYKPGNGLGLYLCRLIVKRLSGTIYVDAAYEQGTCIIVELPAGN